MTRHGPNPEGCRPRVKVGAGGPFAARLNRHVGVRPHRGGVDEGAPPGPIRRIGEGVGYRLPPCGGQLVIGAVRPGRAGRCPHAHDDGKGVPGNHGDRVHLVTDGVGRRERGVSGRPRWHLRVRQGLQLGGGLGGKIHRRLQSPRPGEDGATEGGRRCVVPSKGQVRRARHGNHGRNAGLKPAGKGGVVGPEGGREAAVKLPDGEGVQPERLPDHAPHAVEERPRVRRILHPVDGVRHPVGHVDANGSLLRDGAEGVIEDAPVPNQLGSAAPIGIHPHQPAQGVRAHQGLVVGGGAGENKAHDGKGGCPRPQLEPPPGDQRGAHHSEPGGAVGCGDDIEAPGDDAKDHRLASVQRIEEGRRPAHGRIRGIDPPACAGALSADRWRASRAPAATPTPAVRKRRPTVPRVICVAEGMTPFPASCSPPT